MRKNEQIIIVIFLILTAMQICAQESHVSVALSDSQAKILLQLKDVSSRSILSSIQENQTAEITFSIRLYQKERGRKPIRAILVKEVSRTQRGLWMPVIQQYMVESDNHSTYFSSGPAFAAAFLSQKFILVLPRKQRKSYYILSRIQLTAIKFLPPFSILEPFFRDYYKTTPWTQTELTG